MRRTALAIPLILLACTEKPAGPAETPGARLLKAVFVVAAEGYQDEELRAPLELLRAKGIQVELASARRGKCTGMLGGEVQAGMALGEVRAAERDALVFVGGLGCQACFADETALRLAREAHGLGKIVAAICFAPRILAQAGLVAEIPISVSEGQAAACAEAGALVQEAPVTVAGKLLTAEGPAAAEEFARRLLELLAGNA